MKRRWLPALAALALCAPLAAQSQPVNVPPGGGISFEQITFLFDEVQQQNSAWARAVADVALLAETTGMTRGFVNIATDQGWVVQNWELDLQENRLREGAPGSLPVFNFRLFEGPPQILSGIPAVIEMSRDPLARFIVQPSTVHQVNFHIVNADGGGGTPTVAIPAPPSPSLVTPDPEGETFSHILPNLANVEAAKDQCFPMSIANSLQYLENRYALPVPNDHVPGLEGDQSLVGKLDTASGRSAPSRSMGDGVWFVPMLEGKFEYLDDEGLSAGIRHRHQGQGYGGSGNQLPDGNFSSNGSTSTEEGNAVTWEWMCQRIQEGCDVEVVYSRHDDAGTIVGGHAVRAYGCGKTLGRPWIKIAHDSTQANDSFGLETPEVYVEDFDNDGTVNFGSASREIQFAFAECPTDELRNGTFSPPQTLTQAIVNGATFLADLAVSGLTTVFGIFNTVANAPLAEEGGPSQLDRIEVLVNGRSAPVFYADSRQINFQIPAETEEGIVSVLVLIDGVPSDLVTVRVGALAPGIFPIPASIAGPGRGAVQNQDFSLNTPARPAAPASAIIAYMSGLGALNPPLGTGEAAPSDILSEAVGLVEATIGGTAASVAFAGATPGFVGLQQVNVVVPALAAGEYELVIRVDGVEANRVQVSVGP